MARWPSATDDSTWDLVKRDALRRKSSSELLNTTAIGKDGDSDPYARPQDAVQTAAAASRPPAVPRRLSGQDITYATLPNSPTIARARGALPKPPKPIVDAQGYTEITQTEDEDGYTQIRTPARRGQSSSSGGSRGQSSSSGGSRGSGEYEYAEFVRPAPQGGKGDNGYVVPNPPMPRRR